VKLSEHGKQFVLWKHREHGKQFVLWKHREHGKQIVLWKHCEHGKQIVFVFQQTEQVSGFGPREHRVAGTIDLAHQLSR
jgi:hypothetical protein